MAGAEILANQLALNHGTVNVNTKVPGGAELPYEADNSCRHGTINVSISASALRC